MARRPGKDEDEILDFTDGDDDGRSGQAPLLFSIALGLIMVFAILVTGWYFLADSKGSPGSGGVPVVQADPAPIKTKPSDPGGMEVPNQDKLVYERLGQGETQPQGERLLPPPEAPQMPPKYDPNKLSLATPKPEPMAPESPAEKPAAPRPGEPPAATPAPQAPVVTAAVPDPARKPEPAKPDAAKVEPVKPEPAKPAETKTAAVTPAPAPAPASAPATGTLQPPKAAEKTAEKPADKPAAAPAPLKLGKGDWQIQLAALRDIETAQREWSKIAAANKDVLTGLSPDIVRADLGAKGIFFRLRAGPLDEPSARRLCDELGKRKIGCMVVHK